MATFYDEDLLLRLGRATVRAQRFPACDVDLIIRLNLMHYLWKEQVGYLLHPQVNLPSCDAHIAEIGTGTG